MNVDFIGPWKVGQKVKLRKYKKQLIPFRPCEEIWVEDEIIMITDSPSKVYMDHKEPGRIYLKSDGSSYNVCGDELGVKMNQNMKKIFPI